MGKLVLQDPNDEPSTILSDIFNCEKEKIPFEIPRNWGVVPLEEIKIKAFTGLDIPKKLQSPDYEYFYFKMNNITKDGKCYFADLTKINTSSENVANYQLNDGDFLFNTRNSYELVGKTCVFNNISNEKFVFNNNILKIKFASEIDPNFVNIWFISPSGRELLNNLKSSTTNVAAIYQGKLMTFVVLIPPYKEQKRIVSKVDELMALCDKLEACRQKKQELQSKLNSAALDRMLSADNQEEFEQYWQRICENFDILYDNPENVEKLKKYILKLGVEGKLVPTESELAKTEGRDYESADSLLKSSLINRDEEEIKSKNKNNFESIEINDPDETLPEGWIWTSIGQVTECLDHVRIPVNKKEREERVGNIPYYGANGRVGWIDNYIFDEPLVLVVEDETFIGRQKPFCYKIVGKSWVNNHAHVLRSTEAVDVDFLNYSLAYYPFIPLTSGTTGRKKLNKSTLIAAPYKLPPLAEQKRIVEKIEQLMGLCDELELKLRKAREDSEKLLETVVKGLLEGAAA